MTSHTAAASTVHEPIGSPSGPGLWHHKGLQLPAYMQHVAHHLIGQGHDESRAIEMAVGIVKNWAEGHDGHGNKTHPDVQAAAAKAVAEWEALKAGSGKARRSAVADNKKPYGDVTYADPKNGKYPIDTEAHARAAWSYINQADNAAQYPMNGVTLSEVKDRIMAACKKFGIDVSDNDGDGGSDAPASRSAWRDWEPRPYPLEDIRILARADGGSGGVIVEAYATVFDQPAEINDGQGHYMEVIDRTAFDQTLARIQQQPGGFPHAIKVLYNHGKTAGGEEAPEFQVPIGVPLEIRPEARGLLTRTEYDPSDPFAERILSKIRSGAITAQSFVGSIIRSDPSLRGPGDRYRARNGALSTVRRTALGLREYGPVLWPAYSGAQILGVRMRLPGAATEGFDSPEQEEHVPANEGDVTGSVPEDTTSARYHQHTLYALRSRELRERAGLTW